MLAETNPEKPRVRYVEDAEYDTVFELAKPYLRPAMDLARLCRMRKIEILTATKHQVLEQGFDTKRRKGSRDTITRWSPRLRAAVRMALETPRRVDGVNLLQNRDGQPITETAFNSAWRRLMQRARAAGIEPFTFHDLKAKGVSDSVDKQAAAGHLDAKMLRVYDRKKPIVDRRPDRVRSLSQILSQKTG